MPAKDLELIDRLIGQSIRFHRLKRQMTQVQLADRIRVTFQQVQKYESAANRVSAGRLFRIGQVLEVPVNAFFDGLDEIGEVGEVRVAPAPSLAAEREAGRLIQAYSQITDAKLRRRIVELLEEIASR